jgi:tetratricopeptide (TPR) repeat protein
LLPGTAGCVALVTSRSALAGLVARDGAERLDLNTLPLDDAVYLLRMLVGERAHAESEAAASLVTRCARLPLAVRVAAELAAARPSVPLSGLVNELSDERRRLDLLDANGDPRTAVRAVFSWSYQHLDHQIARGFRMVGLLLGPDFDRRAVAALTGLTTTQADDLLDALTRACLIHTTEPGRYGMHDLLRGYARELSADHDGETTQHAALTRLFDYYAHGASTAVSILFRAPDGNQNGLEPDLVPASDRESAQHWLEAERGCLAVIVAYTAENGWPSHTIRMAATLRQYLENGGHFPEATDVHGHALNAARVMRDPLAEADALDNLGRIAWLQGRQPQAVSYLTQALALFRENGDANGQARAQLNLGVTAGRQGHFRQATGHLREALQLFRDTGDRSGQARALNNLGCIDLHHGRYQAATVHLQAAYDLSNDVGDRASALVGLNNLSVAEARLGDFDRARAHLEHALALSSDSHNRLNQAHLLATLGEVDLRQQRYPDALANGLHARTLCAEIGDRHSEVTAINLLGDVLLAMSRLAEASDYHARALRLAEHIGSSDGQAAAHNGLARNYQASGDEAKARFHWEQALRLYSGLGSPEADEIRALVHGAAATSGRR